MSNCMQHVFYLENHLQMCICIPALKSLQCVNFIIACFNQCLNLYAHTAHLCTYADNVISISLLLY